MIIKAQPVFSGSKYVFTARHRQHRTKGGATLRRGDGPLSGFNKRKRALDKASGVKGWSSSTIYGTPQKL